MFASTHRMQETSQELSYFFQLSTELLCILSEDGRFLQSNPQWQKALGYAESHLQRQRLLDFVHPDDVDVVENQLRNLWATRLSALHQASPTPTPIDFEARFRAASGSYHRLCWNVSLCPSRHQIYAIVRDLSARSSVARAVTLPGSSLSESGSLEALSLAAIRDYGILLLDAAGCVLTWNTGAERITGYSAAEMQRQSIVCLFTPEDVAAGKLQQDLEIAASVGRHEDENWRLHKDGSPIWVHAVTTPVQDAAGNLVGFSQVMRDVTECHRTEIALQQAYHELEKRVEERTEELWRKNEQLEQAHEELQQLNVELVAQAQDLTQLVQDLKKTQIHLIQSEKMSSLGQLVAGVAHEINNPVNFIHGNLGYADQYIRDLLGLVDLYQQQYYPTHEIQEKVEAIDLPFLTTDLPKLLQSMAVGVDRIRQIVLSLRNFSRLDEAEKKPVNVHEGIDSTLLILQNRLKPKADRPSITVVKNYANLPLVECYPGQLNQVFMNILSNAIDALEELDTQALDGEQTAVFPVIRITTEQISENRVAIRMSDNGRGIPELVKNRLFDPFFTTKPIGKGTGLGLSISYQIVVEKHGGSLHCDSAPGQGTEFIVEIPLQQADSALSKSRGCPQFQTES